MTRNTLTYLYNKMWEAIERAKLEAELKKLAETIRNNNLVFRINKEKNRITRLANDQLNLREIKKLGETVRHNIVTELETNRSNLSNEEIKTYQNAINKYDAETRRIEAETHQKQTNISQKQADTAEKKLVTDIIGSAMKGAAVAGIAKVAHTMGKAAVAKQFVSAMQPVASNPSALAALGSMAAKLGSNAIGALSGAGKGALAVMSTPAAAAITGAAIGMKLGELEIAKDDLSKYEAVPMVDNSQVITERKQLKEAIVHGFNHTDRTENGGENNYENSRKSSQNDAPSRYGGTDPRGPGYNLGESTNKSSGNGASIYYSPGTKEKIESGPGIGLAFS